jgi:hypothetical protein
MRPFAPEAVVTSASKVGLPRESRISRAMTLVIEDMEKPTTKQVFGEPKAFCP